MATMTLKDLINLTDLADIRASKLGFECDEDLENLMNGGQIKFNGDHEIKVISSNVEKKKGNSFVRLNSNVYVSATPKPSEEAEESAEQRPVFFFEGKYVSTFLVSSSDLPDLVEDDKQWYIHVLGQFIWPYMRRDFISSLQRAGLGDIRLPFHPPEHLF